MKNINEFTNDWYGSLEELIEELTNEGYEVLEANGEYITCTGDEDDTQYALHLVRGTRAIEITEIEEIEF